MSTKVLSSQNIITFQNCLKVTKINSLKAVELINVHTFQNILTIPKMSSVSEQILLSKCPQKCLHFPKTLQKCPQNVFP